MSDSAEYRRSWMDLHECADQFRTLPYRHPMTPEKLTRITAHLQRTYAELVELHNSFVPESTIQVS